MGFGTPTSQSFHCDYLAISPDNSTVTAFNGYLSYVSSSCLCDMLANFTRFCSWSVVPGKEPVGSHCHSINTPWTDGFHQVDGCQYPKDGNSTFIDCVTQHARSASSSQCGIRYNAEIIEIILGVLGFIALVGILGILEKVIQDKCRSTTPFCCSREKITIVAGKLVEEEPYRALREVA